MIRRRIPPRRRRHDFLHSFLPIIMGHKQLAQVDSTATFVWDAARAVVMGTLFVWSKTPVPILILTAEMLISFVIMILATHQAGPIPGHPLTTLGAEIKRMVVTMLFLLAIKAVILLTTTNNAVVFFFAGAFAWIELGTIRAYAKHAGMQLPAPVESAIDAAIRIRSEILGKLINAALSGEAKKRRERRIAHRKRRQQREEKRSEDSNTEQP